MDNISIYIINYNGGEILLETLKSVSQQDYPSKIITLIDDGSTDESVSLSKQYYPNIDIIGLGYNSKALNKLRNLAIIHSKNPYLFIMDNDIFLEKDCLTKLISVMKSDQRIGLSTPRLVYYTDHAKTNISWTKLHYICNSISPKRDSYTEPEKEPVDTIGGGIMLIDKNKIKETGGFDESLPMGWGDDADIYIKMNIAGYKAVHVPYAIGYHHVKEWSKNRQYRAFGQIYNRWFIILTMYQIKTILFALPVFFIYELFLFFTLTSKKLTIIYFHAIFVLVENIKIIIQKRHLIQSRRKADDVEFLTAGDIYIPQVHLSNQISRTGIIILNKVLFSYWKLIKIFCNCSAQNT